MTAEKYQFRGYDERIMAECMRLAALAVDDCVWRQDEEEVVAGTVGNHWRSTRQISAAVRPHLLGTDLSQPERFCVTASVMRVVESPFFLDIVSSVRAEVAEQA